MVNLEQVEELRKRANITYDEAKKALEEADGDILEAIINLEKEGKIKPPKNGGYYSTKGSQETEYSTKHEKTKKNYDEKGLSIGDLLKKAGKLAAKIIDKGNKNKFIIMKNGEKVSSFPVLILGLFIIFIFWFTVPLLIVGLFLGYKYRFAGPDLGKENLNNAMDSVAGVAESIKKEVKGGKSDEENSDN